MSHHLDTPLAREMGSFTSTISTSTKRTAAPCSRWTSAVEASGTSNDPRAYGDAVSRRRFPDVLPYVVGTPATYSFATFNGRTLADNAPEVMLSLVTNSAVPTGLKPSVAAEYRTGEFPYVVPARALVEGRS